MEMNGANGCFVFCFVNSEKTKRQIKYRVLKCTGQKYHRDISLAEALFFSVFLSGNGKMVLPYLFRKSQTLS